MEGGGTAEGVDPSLALWSASLALRSASLAVRSACTTIQVVPLVRAYLFMKIIAVVIQCQQCAGTSAMWL